MAKNAHAEHPSHLAVSQFLADRFAAARIEMLEVGVMPGVTYGILRSSPGNFEYTDIDISENALEDSRTRYPEATWQLMPATDLEFDDASFDVVQLRHLVECLPYYETAIREAFRVARKYVVIGLSVVPREPEKLLRRVTADGYIWLNRYAPGPLEGLLGSLSDRVERSEHSRNGRSDCLYLCTKRAA